MDRITGRFDDGVIYIKSETGTEGIGYFTTKRRIPEIIARLASYEDIGTVEEFRVLKDAAQKGVEG